jgi:hypothetical protein
MKTNISYFDTFEKYYKSRRIRWSGHVARMRDKNNAYRILVGNQERGKKTGKTKAQVCG